MQVTPDVLNAFATQKVADLLLTGDAKEIIQGLLNNRAGTQIANIGNVVSVKLSLQELARLAADEISIEYVQLNRNVKDAAA